MMILNYVMNTKFVLLVLKMTERLDFEKHGTNSVIQDLDSRRSNLRFQGFILHYNNLTAYTHAHSIFRV